MTNRLLVCIIVLITISCATEQRYYPKNYPETEGLTWNKYLESVLKEMEEPPIYDYSNKKAYRFYPPHTTAIIRIEKNKDNSCVLIAKELGEFTYSFSSYEERKAAVIDGPIPELRVEIKRECDKAVDFEKLDALFPEETYYENKGEDFKEGMMYSDSITMERVTEDGTYYFFNSREQDKVKKIKKTIDEVFSRFIHVSLFKMF